MRVAPATSADLMAVRAAYADGRALQREQGSIVWPAFSEEFLLTEIAAERLLLILGGDALIGVFNVAYEDGAIWGELERGSHIYLHRIVKAAGHGTSGLMTPVLAWARERCRELGRTGVRMDTWAGNAALIAHYERLGFTLVGVRRMPADPRLSPHYHGIELALLEYEIGAAPSVRHPDTGERSPAARRRGTASG